MATIDYPIDQLMQTAQNIDTYRFDACQDAGSPAFGQATPHHHDAAVNDVQQKYHHLFTSLQIFVDNQLDRLSPLHDESPGIMWDENPVQTHVAIWNARVRSLYNDDYKAIAEALRDAAASMAALDNAGARAFQRNGPVPQ